MWCELQCYIDAIDMNKIYCGQLIPHLREKKKSIFSKSDGFRFVEPARTEHHLTKTVNQSQGLIIHTVKLDVFYPSGNLPLSGRK